MGIEKDVEELINEGWIRVVEVTDGKKRMSSNTTIKRIFFPRDKLNTDVEVDPDILPSNC